MGRGDSQAHGWRRQPGGREWEEGKETKERKMISFPNVEDASAIMTTWTVGNQPTTTTLHPPMT